MKAGFTGDHGRRYLGLGGHSKYAWTESCGNDAIYCCYPVYSHVGLLQEAVAKARSWTSRAELVIFVGGAGDVWERVLELHSTLGKNRPDQPRRDAI